MRSASESHGSLNLPLEDRPSQIHEHGPVFVMGCPRSGTTFLSKALAGFTNLEEFTGILAPPRFMHLCGREKDAERLDELVLCIQDIFWQAFWRRLYYREERLLQVLRKNRPWKHLFSAPNINGVQFCYKEPFLAFAAEAFASRFPKAKFIHIIRDGRDNADSMERTYPEALSDAVLSSDELCSNKNSEIGFWETVDDFRYPWWLAKEDWTAFRKGSQYVRSLFLWKAMVSRGRRLKTKTPDRYLEVHYEALVTRPDHAANELSRFLEHPLDERFLKKLKAARKTSIKISSLNQSPEKLAEARAVAGGLLEELGYN